MSGRGSIVCPDCGRLVGIGEPSCPNCGRWQPALFGAAPFLQRVFGTLEATQLVFWVCCILYAGALALDPAGAFRNSGRGILGILAPSMGALTQLGMTGDAVLYVPIGNSRYLIDFGQLWWTPLSATFLHGGILHIFFNMMWLRMLGPQIEESLGPGRFFLVYMAGGVGGFVVSNIFSGNPTVGASGAIFGLLAATIVLGRRHGGEWGAAVGQQALMYAGILFLFGFFSRTTNNWAHGGGFIAGGIAMWILVRQSGRAEGPLTQVAALLIAVATLAAIVGTLILIRFG